MDELDEAEKARFEVDAAAYDSARLVPRFETAIRIPTLFLSIP